MNEGKPGPSGERESTPEPAHNEPRSTDGDFELARPQPPAPHEGDYELDRPRAPIPPTPEAPADGETAEQETVPPAAAAASASVAAEEEQHGVSVEETAAPSLSAPAAPAAEQPKPLHDPDPYSTPPYGEPGPWAPAPPVQHPATTPAHGMAVPPPVTTHRGPHEQAPAPSSAPAPAPVVPVPAQETPAPAPGVSAPASGSHAPAAGVSAPPTAGHAPVPGIPAQVSDPHATVPGAAAHAASGVPQAPASAAPDPWRRYDPWAAAAAPAPFQLSGEAVESEARRRKRRARIVVGALLVFAVVCGLAGGLVGAYLERNGGVGAVELPQAGKEDTGREPGSVAGIAAQALPSVVTLHVSGGGEAGTGTGFVLDTRGHILTNDHVVGPAGDDGEITVTFHSGDTAEATVVGRDSGYDLAVVKVKGVRGLAPLPLGNSDNVQVGDPVVAIGAPFDLAGTVTSGIISAKERPITAGGEEGDGSDVSYVDALQTDAPINPGNSGGPLLDAKARVIGINSAIRSADSGADTDGGQAGSIGLGFAIPINQGKRVAEELINTGKATHPVIGITLDMQYTGDGARVGTKGSDGGPPVSTGGPGDKAGIKPGDVITKVDGRPVHSGEELIVKTRAHRPGDRLELTLERDGEERTVSLVLGSSDGE
ncbi:trypsin-like peptidase domain-containing protein [Streptomyces sp. 15-116A]|uniref:trypsin-like peptidase domain-containing protein n=1 Tax=Streptomyces sp. 15-116A TaxID=2259035 RepID=UPI0021B36F2A|nr:trypsin-like peptidase domain-containing protein [Streptomyces sp. 15-116A]MCT7354636.1 trypsin-like peptidase domain-containing protein [Streptomyces sp. 15-116A]